MEAYPSLLSARTLRKNDLLGDDDYDTESLKTLKADSGTQTKKRIISSGITKGPSRSIKQIFPTQKPKRRKVKLMNWKKYHRLNVIYSFIDELEKDYPAICTVSVIGKSVEGRDIKCCSKGLLVIEDYEVQNSNDFDTPTFNTKWRQLVTDQGTTNQRQFDYSKDMNETFYEDLSMLKISNSDASNSAVWLDASIHPREWISTAVLTYIADVIVKNFHSLSKSITNKDWHIVPVLNPDGYEYTHTHDRMWRKNKAVHLGEVVGVDLNRNFSYAWGKNGDEGSSEDPNNVFYRGPEPFSEPEAVAVRDTILGSTIPFKVFLSFHSYFELIIFPWGHKSEPCADYLSLLEGGTIMARAIYDTTGKTYRVGCTKDMTYYACGTSIDWSYAVAKIPYSYMLELRSKRHKFKLPRDQIIDNCTEIWSAVKSLMDFVDQSSKTVKHPE